ncbi:glutaredoxin domain-containing protein, partial [Psychrobacter sp. 1Y4]
MTVPVRVYTTPICPYCSNAKQLLKTKGVDYEEIGMHDMSSEDRQALM